MKVPLGNFGNTVAEPVAQPNKGAAFSHAADVIEGVAQVQAGIEERAQRNREALQRAKAANAFATYQYDVENTGRDIEEGMADGSVDYEHAQEEFDARVKKLQAPKVELDNPIDRENHSAALTITQNRQRLALAPSIFAARQRDGIAQLDGFFDTQAKRAIEPEANVEAINQSADAFAANAREYGVPQDYLAKRVQAFKDTNWFNNATQRAVEADQDVPGLKAILHDLTAKDGLYADKLDPDKRNALQASVQSKLDRIEMRGAAIADRREAKAERTLATFERQISSGVPATTEMWTDGASTVKGTSVEGDFNELVHAEREIQAVLRAPIADQARLVQERQAALDKGGGTLVQAANVERLKRAVDTNVKTLMQTPILFGEQRLGDKNEPIDFAANLLDQSTGDAATTMLQERASHIRALSSQFGAPVPLRPLLPQEAKQLSQMLEGSAPSAASDFLTSLRDTAGSSDVFRGMMAQVAPDQPVKASAGVLASMRRDLTTGTHWFDPDDTVTSRDVAATMLEGDRILNPSGAAKKEDGKPQTQLFLTEAAAKGLQDQFGKVVGDAYRNDPQGAERAFQNVRAYYVGKASKTGALSRDSQTIDTNLVREAVRSTLGNVVDFRGNGNVLAPWGMSESNFEDHVARAIPAALERAGLSAGMAPSDAFGLDDGPEDGVYVITNGRRWVRDANNQPVLLDIRPPDARESRGFIRRGGQ